MKTIQTAFFILTLLTASVASAQTTVFDHDFANATPGDLSAAGALGTPAAGTFTASGGFVSSETVANEGLVNEFTLNSAYTTGSNAGFNSIETVADGSFNDVGIPAGNFLTANLSDPAAVTGTLGAGQTTTVNFELAVFGTSNANAFKYLHVRGLSSNGAEVFQLVYRAGSGPATREIYARQLDEDNTTFAAGVYSSTDGSLILDNIQFGLNSVNTDAMPTGRVAFSITIDQSGWNASAAPISVALDAEGNPAVITGVETPATGLAIASGAPDLASIVFFTSQNATTGTQNSGLWLDSLVVATDLTVEPSDTLLGDFNGDQVVNCDDLDGYVGNIGATVTPALAPLDIDNDGTITSADANTHITTLVQTSNGQVGTFPGDLNCDGTVNVLGDAFALIGNLNNSVTRYSQGDINFDGTVNVLGDAFTLIGNLNNSNNP